MDNVNDKPKDNTYKMLARVDLLNGITNGIAGYYSSKAQGYYQGATLYNQSIPLYQQISAKTRELQNQQALAYLNSGVDITQGTASYVLNHTTQQGLMKMEEIKNNVAIQVRNAKKLSSTQATQNLMNGIVGGATEATKTLVEGYERQKNIDNGIF